MIKNMLTRILCFIIASITCAYEVRSDPIVTTERFLEFEMLLRDLPSRPSLIEWPKNFVSTNIESIMAKCQRKSGHGDGLHPFPDTAKQAKEIGECLKQSLLALAEYSLEQKKLQKFAERLDYRVEMLATPLEALYKEYPECPCGEVAARKYHETINKVLLSIIKVSLECIEESEITINYPSERYRRWTLLHEKKFPDEPEDELTWQYDWNDQ
ncbi:MAG: hypothetical protein HQL73_05025 [Magnetococcales bacterium]|nr:hypothetical protein [Magnetococcales bacterium]